MEKPYSDSKKDILQEEYKGPGKAVTSAGYMAMSHLLTMIVSGIVLGTVGALAHTQVASVQETFAKIGHDHAESSNLLKRGAAKVIGGIPKLFKWCAEHVPFSKKITGSVKFEDKAPSIIFMGGLGVAGGWIGSTIWGIAKGSHQGGVGKRQFERAKHEISNLREDNADLNKINDELHAKYVKAATRLDTIQAAQDAARSELPLANEAPATNPTLTPNNEVQLAQVKHQGKAAEPEMTANIS